MKYVIILTIINILQASSPSFDPESVEFSKASTLRTWIHSELKNSKCFWGIQQNVAMFLPQYPSLCIASIPANPGQKEYYGKAFPTIAAIELPFLQFVHGLKGKPLTLELGAGLGYVSWKVLFAMEGDQGGTHIVNDISERAIKERIPELLSKGFSLSGNKNKIEYDLGDFFDILTRRPDLKGKVNAVMVQNVEHFLNPIRHSRLLSLLSELLAEGGQAFLCAHTHDFEWNPSDVLAKLYFERKLAGDIYPGFNQHTYTFHQLSHRPELIKRADLVDRKYNALRPKDDAVLDLETLAEPVVVGQTNYQLNGTMFRLDIVKMTQRVQQITFDTDTYQKAVLLHPSLCFTDTFFIDRMGNRASQWNTDRSSDLPVTSHVAAILKKRIPKEITPSVLLIGLYYLLCNIRANQPELWEQMLALKPQF